jgi:hypothetical protein
LTQLPLLSLMPHVLSVQPCNSLPVGIRESQELLLGFDRTRTAAANPDSHAADSKAAAAAQAEVASRAKAAAEFGQRMAVAAAEAAEVALRQAAPAAEEAARIAAATEIVTSLKAAAEAAAYLAAEAAEAAAADEAERMAVADVAACRAAKAAATQALLANSLRCITEPTLLYPSPGANVSGATAAGCTATTPKRAHSAELDRDLPDVGTGAAAADAGYPASAAGPVLNLHNSSHAEPAARSPTKVRKTNAGPVGGEGAAASAAAARASISPAAGPRLSLPVCWKSVQATLLTEGKVKPGKSLKEVRKIVDKCVHHKLLPQADIFHPHKDGVRVLTDVYVAAECKQSI